MIVIGLTGGIGSGKSTVGAMFQDLGVPVYNSDERAKELMNTSAEIKKELTLLFGNIAYLEGKLNSSHIAKKVFKDADLLEALNKIVHPKVRTDFLNWSKKQNSPYVIQETALLFENNAQALYDKVILVTAPKMLRIERLLRRDKSSRAQIEARMNNQLEDAVKIQYSDYIIENSDLVRTNSKVLELHHRILTEL